MCHFLYQIQKRLEEEEKNLVLIRLILFLRHPKIILNTCKVSTLVVSRAVF